MQRSQALIERSRAVYKKKSEASIEIPEDLHVKTALPKQLANPEKIVERYNSDVRPGKSAFNTDVWSWRGEKLPQTNFVLAKRNKVVEVAIPPLSKNIDVGISWFGRQYERLAVFNQGTAFWGANDKYVLHVPQGKYVLAWLENSTMPVIYDEGTHFIRDSTFKFANSTIKKCALSLQEISADVIDKGESYINHSVLRVIRVPKGQILKCWIDNEPFFLEGRDRPYFLNNPTFKLARTNFADSLVAATDNLIELGSYKRIMPKTGEVALVYDNGQLEIIWPGDEPVYMDAANYKVHSFPSTQIQTLHLPSDVRIKKNRQDFPDLLQSETALCTYQTQDSVRVGVNLVIAYRIAEPEKTFQNLNPQDILNHIENVANSVVNTLISSRTLSEIFTINAEVPKNSNSNHINAMEKINESNTALLGDANISNVNRNVDKIKSLQMLIIQRLTDDLNAFGIHLIRFSIEEIKILDKDIALAMSKQSLLATETAAKKSIIDKQADIVNAEAERDAAALLIRAEAKRKAAEIEAKAIHTIGQAYADNPKALELKIAETIAKTLNGASIALTPEKLVGMFSSSFFTPKDQSQHQLNPDPKQTANEKSETIQKLKPTA